MQPYHIHLVSDSTGETVGTVARACLVQFTDFDVEEHIWPMVRTAKQIAEVVAGIKAEPGLVLYTLVNDNNVSALEKECQDLKVPYIGLLNPVIVAMGHYLDGRVSAVIGTHTHVPTADLQILPGGTAYQSDIGMCGDYNSVIGMTVAEPLQRFTRKISGGRFEPAQGTPTLCGVYLETDDRNGRPVKVAPLRHGGRLETAWPV